MGGSGENLGTICFKSYPSLKLLNPTIRTHLLPPEVLLPLSWDGLFASDHVKLCGSTQISD